MMKKSILLSFVLLVQTALLAQIQVPPASPTFEVKGTIGLTEVHLVYSRPSARGRVVAGDLIPYGEVWRTGANASTKISFSTDVVIEGHKVPAGQYALYTIFNEQEATVILSKNIELWGSIGYSADDDQLRFNVPVKHPTSSYETLTMSFSDFTMNSANFNIKWDHTKVMFSIVSQVDELVMSQIKQQVIDNAPTNPGVYFQAAGYYFDTQKNDRMALEWVDKAIAGNEQKQYWVVHLKAKIQARLGEKSAAKATAESSIELAKAAGNPDYIRLNEKLIASLAL
ncbi:MAG: DUF2911 domain-containing protein [Flavobacteriaceae bacterium]|jgi:hypothetical protein|nr:DUF2911 domain-containing protein [Flavobacteriaceae bacterium]MDP4755315.1 DUF2911 domain-containing protein [Flavobacteriaceae bacterium]MDP4793781.1 DUF2911 domain-containing protein [Flavobacteriaceae bacterium]MDP4971796.1 DUF2911 domain-containing protein [Flavobacteriaceae bacterium]MDP5113507.1 DUF2911 domain-containing protein [Flavobacteriaceae bacterium]